MKKSTDIDYDPTTLYIPPNVYKKFKNLQKQYWDIKRHNFDKVVFFRVFRCFEIYYDDAVVAKNLLDLYYIGGRMTCMFYKSRVIENSEILARHGYKVAIVE